MSTINTNVRRPIPAEKPAEKLTRLENLYKTVDQLRKQLKGLHERLENCGDVAERMAIRQQIASVEEMIEAIRRQIMVITQLEKQKQAARPQAPNPGIAAPARETDGQGEGGGTYRPPYAPGE
jgi:TolA-binding protein